MESSDKINQIKQCDIVNYLESINILPTKVSNENYWYLSPLRLEKTPSFKVNRNKNLWFDFGLGRGGSLIDFLIHFKDCTIAEILKEFTDATNPKLQFTELNHIGQEKARKIEIISANNIHSYPLIEYLKSRKIPLGIAQKYCCEIVYRLGEKTLYSLGFKNDSGGYELRNKYAKLSSSPKDMTTILNGSKNLSIFEGFFDFLSFITITNNQLSSTDFLILNSLSFFEKSKTVADNYETIDLFLDNNAAGQNCSQSACDGNKKYKNQSGLYKGFEDLNDWLTKFGKQPKHKTSGLGFKT